MVTMPAAPTTDVFVIGGGPAGLAAGIAARRYGFDVTVADLSWPPIDKACGEGLMPDAAAAMRELGIDLQGFDTGTFRGIRFLGDGVEVEADFPRGRGIGVRRTVLHQALVNRANDAGVRMLWGARVSAVRNNAVVVDGRAVACRWVVGADGQNSQVRRWAGLTAGRDYKHRIGVRRHFSIRPWSELVEVYWGPRTQLYVSPVGANQIGVALLSKDPVGDFASALQDFPELKRKLGSVCSTSDVKGAPLVTRSLKSVTHGRFALVGDASGSVDAVTGEGIGMAFRQALALGRALASDDLSMYEAAHCHIRKRPHLMARTMLLMDSSAWLRHRALRALAANPSLFRRLLSVHVGEHSLLKSAVPAFFNLGWQILTA